MLSGGYVLLSGSTSTSIAPITQVATELFTWVTTSMADLWQFISSNPLLLTFVAMTIVGFIIGVFGRLLRLL